MPPISLISRFPLPFLSLFFLQSFTSSSLHSSKLPQRVWFTRFQPLHIISSFPYFSIILFAFSFLLSLLGIPFTGILYLLSISLHPFPIFCIMAFPHHLILISYSSFSLFTCKFQVRHLCTPMIVSRRLLFDLLCCLHFQHLRFLIFTCLHILITRVWSALLSLYFDAFLSWLQGVSIVFLLKYGHAFSIFIPSFSSTSSYLSLYIKPLGQTCMHLLKVSRRLLLFCKWFSCLRSLFVSSHFLFLFFFFMRFQK